MPRPAVRPGGKGNSIDASKSGENSVAGHQKRRSDLERLPKRENLVVQLYILWPIHPGKCQDHIKDRSQGG